MLELNKIYNIDCIEGLKLIDDNSIDLIVTSPPYNIGIDYDSYEDNKTWNEYLFWMEQWLKERFRVLKDDGRICINHYLNFQDRWEKVSRFPLFDIQEIQKRIGFNVHKLCLWEDSTRKKYTAWGSYLSASSPYINTPYEGILISYKKQWKKINDGESDIDKNTFLEGVSGIWKLGTTKSITKANFPESLPNMCIKLLSFVGDTVLDPFMGSGTTGVSCVKNNRNYIGFEISEKYSNIAQNRINGIFNKQELF